jgi:Na+-driven multidrug efflux pump
MHLCVSDVQVAFYSLITYFATSMGTNTVAAHQVGSTQTSSYSYFHPCCAPYL